MKRALLLVVAASCHHAPPPRAPLVLTRVTSVDAPSITSLVEDRGVVYAFGLEGAIVVRAGAVAARDELRFLGEPSTIAAPDGNGRWVVAGLQRVLPDGSVVAIDAERLGLSPRAPWDRLYGAGTTLLAASAKDLAVSADGHHVSLYAGAGANALAVAPGRIAIGGATGVDAWDLAAGTSRTYALAGARVAFVGARLVAWTDAQVRLEDAHGALQPLATSGAIASVVAAGSRLWVRDARGLATLADAEPALVPAALDLRGVGGMFGSPTGDLWLTRAGHLERYTVGAGADPAWQADVAPVFARSCAHCHLPDGSAGVDLSTAPRWAAERDEIRKRVLVAHSMPPAGEAPLADTDRAALAAWLGR